MLELLSRPDNGHDYYCECVQQRERNEECGCAIKAASQGAQSSRNWSLGLGAVCPQCKGEAVVVAQQARSTSDGEQQAMLGAQEGGGF